MSRWWTAVDSYFGIGDSGSTVGREVIGGLTTFATMSYIIFVQPAVLSAAGMPAGSVLVATCAASALSCFLMGFVARYPFALAPGMGENFLFAFTICSAAAGGMGFSWQAGLAIVFIAGLLFLVLSLFGVRQKLLEVLPDCLKNSIGPAIGMFIAFVGFQWGGIVVQSGATMVTLGDIGRGPALVTVIGVVFITVLLALNIRGGILLGLLVTAALSVVLGVVPFSLDAPEFSLGTFFQLDFAELSTNWHGALVAIALLFFLDLFDTVGTLVGVSRQAGFMGPHGTLPRARQAFFADAAGTCLGALCGTSTVTTFIESATGVAAGARTGLAAAVTGLCFLLAIFLAPLVHLAGYNIGPEFYADSPGVTLSMYPVVAPALIVVGFLMLKPLREVQWDDVTESFPAFLTVVLMVLGYGITEGIAMGVISFALIKTLTGRWREVHPIMYGVALALALRYALIME